MTNSTFSTDRGTYRKRNHLPHVDVPGGIYFVTFCLADAIPLRLILEAERLREDLRSRHRSRYGEARIAANRSIDREVRKLLFEGMDRGYGGCELGEPEIACIVRDSLLCFDRSRYRLITWCVMPNHVHSTFRPRPDIPWWKVVGAWKSFTSKEINKLLGRSGKFWQDDNYDRLIRSSAQMDSANRYVLRNPEKAGLDDWPWVGQVAFPPVESLSFDLENQT